MGYQGDSVGIPVGSLGLRTDDPDSRVNLGNLIYGMNVTYRNGRLERAPGSRRWNQTALGTGIKGAIEWRPNENTSHIVVAGKNGRVYRFKNKTSYTEISAASNAPTALQITDFANFISAGVEERGRDRKLFLFTGNSKAQVIAGDSTSRRDIANPAPEWTGTDHPVGGFLHRNRLFTWTRFTHTVLASSATDHEDFTSSPLVFDVFPGDGEYIVDGFVFRGKAFVLKYPQGLYILNDQDASSANWFFTKLDASLGAQNFMSHFEAFDDMFVANQMGGISSLSATDRTGDVESSDLFGVLRVQDFVRQNLRYEGLGVRQALYYPDRKTGMFLFQGRTSSAPDHICYLDFSMPQQPKVFWGDKDQANCLFKVKDLRGTERPFYGSNDGYVYEMDVDDRWVGSFDSSSRTAYRSEFWTPAIDFGGTEAKVAQSTKQFDHLEISYIPTGRVKLTVEVFIDGYLHKTLQFELKGHSDFDNCQFDQARFDAEIEQSQVLPCGGTGRRIQFRCYNEDTGYNFAIVAMIVHLRGGGLLKAHPVSKGA